MTIYIRYQRYPIKPKRRDITPRRLAAAKRALQRQRDKCPLFADQIAERQPTPEERIDKIDEQNLMCWIRLRKSECKNWLQLRHIVRKEICPWLKQEFLERWNKSSCPGSAVYALDSLLQLRRKMCTGCDHNEGIDPAFECTSTY